jgi:hypothetical protein
MNDEPRSAAQDETAPTTSARQAVAKRASVFAEAWRWAALAVPLLAIAELLTHWFEVTRTPTSAQWDAVVPVVLHLAQPSDLVTIAPAWADPIGRQHLGPGLMTIERVAYPDLSRFSRAIEVGLRGSSRDDLRDWTVVGKQDVGPFLVRVRQNPHFVPVIDDLLSHVAPTAMIVQRVDGSNVLECPYAHGSFGTTGDLFGPAVPGDAFRCPSGAPIGVTVMPVLDYSARRCLLAQPPGGSAKLVFRFRDVLFGRAIVGHHGLYVHAERKQAGAPISLAVRGPRGAIADLAHNDGDGWKAFELPTGDLAGTRGELVFEVSAASSADRVYCFEGSTR